MPTNTKSATDKHCSKCKLSSNAKNTIKCPGCHKFIHSKCAGLNHEEFTLFSKCNRHFRCNECLNLFNTLLSNNMFINKLDTTDDELPSNNITPPKSDSNIELNLKVSQLENYIASLESRLSQFHDLNANESKLDANLQVLKQSVHDLESIGSSDVTSDLSYNSIETLAMSIKRDMQADSLRKNHRATLNPIKLHP